MNKNYKIASILLVVFMLGYFVYTFLSIESQINKVLTHPTTIGNQECVSFPTDTFTDGNKMQKKYLYYRCGFKPDLRVLIFYYDLQEKKISNYEILNTDYESIETAGPYFCSMGVTRKDSRNYYERCTVRFIYKTFFIRNDLFFSTPSSKITDSHTITELNKIDSNSKDNVDAFQ